MARVYVVERCADGGTAYYLLDREHKEKLLVTLQKFLRLRKTMRPEHEKLIYVEE